MRIWLFLAAVNGALGVAAGAFGAHALRTRLSPELLAVFETGVRYQLVHAVALMGIALLAARTEFRASGALALSGVLFVGGLLLFCGALYAYALSGLRFFVPFAPVGGTALLAGWIALGWAALSAR